MQAWPPLLESLDLDGDQEHALANWVPPATVTALRLPEQFQAGLLLSTSSALSLSHFRSQVRSRSDRIRLSQYADTPGSHFNQTLRQDAPVFPSDPDAPFHWHAREPPCGPILRGVLLPAGVGSARSAAMGFVAGGESMRSLVVFAAEPAIIHLHARPAQLGRGLLSNGGAIVGLAARGAFLGQPARLQVSASMGRHCALVAVCAALL